MDLKFAHYRNRFCMYRTYYALANRLIEPNGFNLAVLEVPDPPSRAHEEALVKGDVEVANLYLPTFLRCRLDGAPLVGIATEWKSTLKGNGLFALSRGPIKKPQDLGGRLIASHHKTPHATHRFLLKRCYGVDDESLRWLSCPQEELLDLLKKGGADAVVLIDQFFFRGEQDPDVRCLYTDGEGWKKLHGFREFIKHMIAVRQPVLEKHPELKGELLSAFKASLAYSEKHLEEIADQFIARYGGEREALLASARYPRIEFTFTDEERLIAEAEMKMLLETGELRAELPLKDVFVA